MMQKCLATQIGKNIQVYINDVVITTKQGLSLIDDLKETFDNLDKFCLKLNPKNALSVSLRESFSEYEALIHGMKMAKACGATCLKIFGDSQLVAQQVMNKCDTVNDSMIAYKEVYNELEKLFDGCKVNHISRLSNDEADVLANIGSQCLPIPPGVFWEEISERSTKPKKIPK
ncbi:hypothetical protein QYE76_024770 [Lolium multiflorum]|uniref:RNase H type-1 domain-containing protein n=1 Tax=Lolium multiflorum TaxID=4521 RepID=A0AAD8RCR2_LOLMU|nr:hypothetical protein QYE76_024770 [Lolium multiflorum]